MDEIDKRAENLLQLGKITNKFENEPFEVRYGLLVNQAREMAFKFNVPYILSQPMLDISRYPKLIEILKILLGPEIGISPIMHLRAKPPSKYGLHNFSYGVPLH